MTSLIEETVNEIALNAPDATVDQIRDYLIQLMEKEILPEAVRNANLPPRPSPFEELRVRHWLKRVRKKRRPREERKLAMWRVTEQFEYIRHAIEGYPSGISDLERRENYFNGTNLSDGARALQGTLLRRRLFMGDGFPIIEPRKAKKRTEELERVLPYNPYKEAEEKGPAFYFDSVVHRRIQTDFLFSRNVGLIESVARLFAMSRSVPVNYFLSFRKDMEIPEWEKYILTVNIVGLDFEKKMKLWDEFDTFVRGRIKERLIHAPEQEAEELRKLDKALFTRFELGEETLAPFL